MLCREWRLNLPTPNPDPDPKPDPNPDRKPDPKPDPNRYPNPSSSPSPSPNPNLADGGGGAVGAVPFEAHIRAALRLGLGSGPP